MIFGNLQNKIIPYSKMLFIKQEQVKNPGEQVCYSKIFTVFEAFEL